MKHPTDPVLHFGEGARQRGYDDSRRGVYRNVEKTEFAAREYAKGWSQSNAELVFASALCSRIIGRPRKTLPYIARPT